MSIKTKEKGQGKLFPIPRDVVDYIMETFPIIKRRDIAKHGYYRTKHQILDIYDAMKRAMDTSEPYQTLLDPPPADPRVAHPESTRPDWAVPADDARARPMVDQRAVRAGTESPNAVGQIEMMFEDNEGIGA